jgi:polyhydroxyalkanoate synthesis regulator phasin
MKDGDPDSAVVEDPTVEGGVVDEAMVKKRSLASLREWVDTSKHRLDEWQKQVDSKIRTTIDGISTAITPWASVNKDVRNLADRISELEAKLRELEAHEATPAAAAAPVTDIPRS